MSGWRTVFVCTLVVASLTAGGAVAPADATSSPTTATISIDGGVVTVTYSNLQPLDDIEFQTGESEIRILKTTGLTRAGDELRPAVGADEMKLRYTVKDSSSSFEAQSSWAFVPVPRGEGRTNLNYRGENVHMYGETAYIGPHETYTASDGGAAVKVTVADPAASMIDGETLAEDIAAFSQEIHFGNHESPYQTLIIPDDSLSGRGGYYDASVTPTVIEAGTEQYDDVTALHEYVHSRYITATGPQMRWWNEGVAQYYALKYGVEFGYITERQRNGFVHRSDNVVLGDASTWNRTAQYQKGAVVIAALDRHVRRNTDNRTFQDVILRLDDQRVIRKGDVQQAITTTTGTNRSAAVVDRYVTTREVPSTWEPAPFYIRYGPELLGGAAVVVAAVLAALYERRRRP